VIKLDFYEYIKPKLFTFKMRKSIFIILSITLLLITFDGFTKSKSESKTKSESIEYVDREDFPSSFEEAEAYVDSLFSKEIELSNVEVIKTK